MIAMLCSAGLAATPPEQLSVLADAVQEEIDRSMEQLKLPDQPGPYLVAVDLLDGDVATASASMGALVSTEHGPYRNGRVEVRVGSYELDNSNFDGGSITGGALSRPLPTDDAPGTADAVRQELWLSIDVAYKAAAETHAAKLAAREGVDAEFPPDLVPIAPLVTEPVGYVDADGARVEQVVTELSAAMASVPGMESAWAMAREWRGVRVLLSSEGHRAWLPAGFIVVRVEGQLRAPDGDLVTDGRWWVAPDWEHLQPLEVMAAEATSAASWTLAAAHRPAVDDYLGPVLFEGPAATELFRQLLAPQLSGSPPPSHGRDVFGSGVEQRPEARLGRRLLPEGWSVSDDPTADPEAAGAYAFDYEGVPARAVPLVEDGVLRGVLMSRIPRADLQASTGHGRSLGAERRVAMPAVVTVRPDKERSERQLRRKALALARQAGLDHVLVVRRIAPLATAEDGWTGDGLAPGLTPPLEAYRLYADGHTEPVRGLGFAGVDRRTLRDIAMAGHVGPLVGVMDGSPGPGRANIGTVGGLPASWAAPPVLIGELELRHCSGDEPRLIPPP